MKIFENLKSCIDNKDISEFLNFFKFGKGDVFKALYKAREHCCNIEHIEGWIKGYHRIYCRNVICDECPFCSKNVERLNTFKPFDKINIGEYFPDKEYFSDFPEEIKEKMMDRQEEQGSKRNFSAFELDRYEGFAWGESIEGFDFWEAVIKHKDFALFFKKYPKEEEFPYKEHFADFPEEIKNKMMDRQEEAGNPRDFGVFERDKYASGYCKGFPWQDTVEGHTFWRGVITLKDFDIFFKKYPKSTFATKYAIGDKFWIMYENKPVEVTIDRVRFKFNIGKLGTVYGSIGEGTFITDDIFPTKESLLDSLK